MYVPSFWLFIVTLLDVFHSVVKIFLSPESYPSRTTRLARFCDLSFVWKQNYKRAMPSHAIRSGLAPQVLFTLCGDIVVPDLVIFSSQNRYKDYDDSLSVLCVVDFASHPSVVTGKPYACIPVSETHKKAPPHRVKCTVCSDEAAWRLYPLARCRQKKD